MKSKSYEDFGDAFLELKEMFPQISYGKIARELDITDSYAWNLPNRRRRSPIPRKYLIKLAEVFRVKTAYFYEYRLQEFLNFIDNNREFLDHCLRQAKRIDRKPTDKPEETIEEFEELEEPEERIKKSASK